MPSMQLMPPPSAVAPSTAIALTPPSLRRNVRSSLLPHCLSILSIHLLLWYDTARHLHDHLRHAVATCRSRPAGAWQPCSISLEKGSRASQSLLSQTPHAPSPLPKRTSSPQTASSQPPRSLRPIRPQPTCTMFHPSPPPPRPFLGPITRVCWRCRVTRCSPRTPLASPQQAGAPPGERRPAVLCGRP